MIVVAILGVLSSVAIPAFSTYLRRAKTGEAYATLDAMFKSVSVYYTKEHATSALIGAGVISHCTVAETESFAGPPSDTKRAYEPTPPFDGETGINFPPGFSYYKFENIGGLDECNRPAATLMYTLTATGDLDGDSEFSTFSLTTVSNDSNELYKAPAVFVLDELE